MEQGINDEGGRAKRSGGGGPAAAVAMAVNTKQKEGLVMHL